MAGPPTPSDEYRNLLRKRLREARDLIGFSRNFHAGDGLSLAALIKNSTLPGSYVAVSSELDPTPLTDGLTSVALPYLRDRRAEMMFRRHDKGELLKPSVFDFLQPGGNAEIVVPDLVLTPLLGFDRNGSRLGQGGGHYDRYFAAHPSAIRIGLAWSVQEVDALPAQPWDVPLDAICTECEWIVPQQSRLRI